MRGATQICLVQKNSPPKQPNDPPPPDFVTLSTHNLTLPDKAGDNQVLLHLFTKWQAVSSQLCMRSPQEWGKNNIRTLSITAKRQCGGKETSDYCP